MWNGRSLASSSLQGDCNRGWSGRCEPLGHCCWTTMTGRDAGRSFQRVLMVVSFPSGGGDPPSLITIDKDVTLIGRSKECDVTLICRAVNTISRRHAEIHITNDGSETHIKDTGSVNGVFVNRVKVNQARLKHGDLIQFGGAAGLPEGAPLAPTSASSSITYRYEERRVASAVPSSQAAGAVGKRVAPSAPLLSGARKRPVEEEEEVNGDHSKRRAVSLGGAHSSLLEDVVMHGAAMEQHEESAEIKAVRQLLGVAAGIALLPTVKRFVEEREKSKVLANDCNALLAKLTKAAEEKGRLSSKIREQSEQLNAKAHVEATCANLEQQLRKALTDKQEQENAVRALVEDLQKQQRKLEETEGALEASEEEQGRLSAQVASVKKEQEGGGAATAPADGRELRETRKTCEALEKTNAALRTKLVELNSKIEHLQAKLTQASLANGGHSKDGGVLINKLKGELCCALCSDLILDVGILPCSHGFCYQCIDAKLAQKRSCPLCHSESSESSRFLGPHVRPRRSTQLDTIILMVAEEEGAMKGAEKNKWNRRLQKQAAFWDSMGGEEVGYREEGGGKHGGGGDEEKTKKKRKKKREVVVCEGCNEEGHTHDECPHRDARDEEEDEDEEED